MYENERNPRYSIEQLSVRQVVAYVQWLLYGMQPFVARKILYRRLDSKKDSIHLEKNN